MTDVATSVTALMFWLEPNVFQREYECCQKTQKKYEMHFWSYEDGLSDGQNRERAEDETKRSEIS